jgi:ATP-dependent Clp protease ATP-binding subunit ClpC
MPLTELLAAIVVCAVGLISTLLSVERPHPPSGTFSRYDEPARRTIFFARYEASRFGSSSIETEHLLLGVIHADARLITSLLKSAASPQQLRQQIEGKLRPGEMSDERVDLPLSQESKRVLAYSAEEAVLLNDRQIRTGHLLLGLLRESACQGAQILHQHGLSLERVRNFLASTDQVALEIP